MRSLRHEKMKFQERDVIVLGGHLQVTEYNQLSKDANPKRRTNSLIPREILNKR